MENLEGRLTPAVILPSANFVTTTQTGTTLNIIANNPGGENNDNQVSLTGGKLVVKGTIKDTITVESEFPIKGLTFFTGITNVNVVLKDGNDDFSMYDVVLKGYLTVDGGTGNNDIELESGEGQGEGATTTVVGATSIITRGGNDYLNISEALLGSLNASLGDGNDVVAITSSSFAGPVFIDTGAGNDCVHVDTYAYGSSFNYPGINVILPTLVVTLGAGDDYFTMGPTGGQVFAGLSFIDGGSGHNYESHCSYSDLSNVYFLNFDGGK